MTSKMPFGVPEADATYARLISLHSDRSEAESMHLNARLILLLINEIGDADIVNELIKQAAKTSCE